MALKLLMPDATREAPNPGARPATQLGVMSEVHARIWRRSADRRKVFSRFLARVCRNAAQCPNPGDRRVCLEDEVRQLVGARAAAIHEKQPGLPRSSGEHHENILHVAVPGGGALHLDIHIDDSCHVDSWTRQILGDAAYVVALVLLVDRRQPEAGLHKTSQLPRGGDLIGTGPQMARLRHEITRMASTDFTILIEGESGSGKELVARQIHEQSARRSGRFVAVNCAALVETLLEAELFGIEDRTATGVRGRRGKFELADGGTLFLDEVSDLSPTAQAKLLRAIQEMSVERVGGHTTRALNTRIVVATNQSLQDLVAQGRFRPDLYYGLSGVDIHVPSLRERRRDILQLANHFLERYRVFRTAQLTDSAADALLAYNWPGNVRELERVVERAVTLATSEHITVDDLPARVTGDYGRVLQPALRCDDTMRAWGSRYARIVLDRCGNNKRKACRVLGISYHTLQAYLSYERPARSTDQTVAERAP